MAKKTPASRAITGEVLDPTPRGRAGPIKLGTPDEMRLELGRVYREMRAGTLDPAVGTKLAFVLGEIRKAYETSVVERRIQAMEGPSHEGTAQET